MANHSLFPLLLIMNRLPLCFPKQDLTSSVVVEPSNYYSPFPGQSQTRSQTDLHLRQSTNLASISFTLVSCFLHKLLPRGLMRQT